MKKLIFNLATIISVSLLIFTSCDLQDETDGTSFQNFEIEDETVAESTFDDIDDVVMQEMANIQGSSSRTSATLSRDYSICLDTVIHDVDNQTITLDFGDDDCLAPDGRERKGKIIIAYSGGRWYEIGSTRIITFENYTVDGNLVEATRTKTTIANDTSDYHTVQTSLTNGKITFVDGSFITRASNFVNVWVRATNPANDQLIHTGSASGTTMASVSYNTNITTPIVFKRSCRSARVFIPVSGIKIQTWDNNERFVNYGDGTCDNLVTITFNGNTREVEVNRRRRG